MMPFPARPMGAFRMPPMRYDNGGVINGPLAPVVRNPLDDLRTFYGADEHQNYTGAGEADSDAANSGYSEIGDPTTNAGKFGEAMLGAITGMMGPVGAALTGLGTLGNMAMGRAGPTLGLTGRAASMMGMMPATIEQVNALANMNQSVIDGMPSISPVDAMTAALNEQDAARNDMSESPQSMSERGGDADPDGGESDSPGAADGMGNDPGGEGPGGNYRGGGRMGAFRYAEGGRAPPRGAMVDAMIRLLRQQMQGSPESYDVDYSRGSVPNTLDQNEMQRPERLRPRAQWDDAEDEPEWHRRGIMDEVDPQAWRGGMAPQRRDMLSMARGGRTMGAFRSGGDVQPGSYIMPADVMSAKGRGSNETGARRMGAFLVQGPGDGRSDSVPARSGGRPLRLSNGEGVIPPHRVRQLGGPDALDRDVVQTRKGYRQEMGAFGRPRGMRG